MLHLELLLFTQIYKTVYFITLHSSVPDIRVSCIYIYTDCSTAAASWCITNFFFFQERTNCCFLLYD